MAKRSWVARMTSFKHQVNLWATNQSQSCRSKLFRFGTRPSVFVKRLPITLLHLLIDGQTSVLAKSSFGVQLAKAMLSSKNVFASPSGKSIPCVRPLRGDIACGVIAICRAETCATNGYGLMQGAREPREDENGRTRIHLGMRETLTKCVRWPNEGTSSEPRDSDKAARGNTSDRASIPQCSPVDIISMQMRCDVIVELWAFCTRIRV